MRVPHLIAAVLLLAATSFAQVPRSNHVLVVLEENTSYSAIYNSTAMPYLNGLAKQYALATKSYGNTHPSIGNYFMLTTGTITTNSDGWTGTITGNNMARVMLTAGVSWKVYAESLPSVGYTGGDKYPYIKHHNPFAYFSDVVNSSSLKLNIVPFTQLAIDLKNGTLPDFAFIIPNQNHNMHDCPAGMSSCTNTDKKKAADAWLKTYIAPVLANADFQKDGLLVITFDEGYASDSTKGGGHVFTTLIGPKVKRGYLGSNTTYQHQSLLRTMLAALGISSNLPGKAATAPIMSEFFTTATTSGGTGCSAAGTALPSVTICSPSQNSTVGSPVQVQAIAASSKSISRTEIWLDGVKSYQTASATINTSLSMSSGTHRLTVQAVDTSGTSFKSTIYVTAN
jgi:phosphatidylinositol-3-phosphatase